MLSGAVVLERGIQAPAAGVVPASAEEGLHRADIEGISLVGPLDRAREAVGGGHPGEVEEGAGEGGDRDAVDDGRVVGVRGRCSVKEDALPALAAASGGNGHIDAAGLRWKEVPESDG
jgi:hypothetical protein